MVYNIKTKNKIQKLSMLGTMYYNNSLNFLFVYTCIKVKWNEYTWLNLTSYTLAGVKKISIKDDYGKHAVYDTSNSQKLS